MGTIKLFVSSLLLLVVVVVDRLLPRAESKTYWGDTEVLKQLKNGVDTNSVSPGSCLSSWNFTVDPCDSLFSERFTCGFRCDLTVSGLSRVTEVGLDSAGYAGVLSSVSWNLPYLQTLDLSNNFFSGWIPGSIANMTQLTRLGLSSNTFSGEIPASIGLLRSLEELYLDNNNLQGPIPASFNGLVSLKRLEMHSNHLSGELPDLGSLKNLYFLDASNNAISGYLPTTLPPSLVQISMRNNMIERTIPQSLQYLSFLQVLDLSHNKLTGSVPYFLFNHPSLQQLNLAFNSFTSVQSPSNVGTQSELIAVDLSNNELEGWLPPFLPLMPKLSALSLENNEFSGMIPVQYALKTVLPGSGIAPFARLLLGGNYLFGPLPGPLLVLKPDTANVSLADNCLIRCPLRFFFCQGANQKSLMECKRFSPAIP
ncbi:LRR receptor-like serine/threonine-protein kinase FLS2 [Durio zibethinus]|uniref:LRR receptor-like serine/threonine-protein kinase FLS2 n=1 Tax=Durio zibethinus TaxID=66656 RepID=A0A6P6BA82_DURZI|nr:LRR receptor-like serine/threonine-protein kinase FLS2 [Durio zibethinus]